MAAAVAARSLEGRNPSPVPYSYPDDDDVDEPWDEPARSPTGNQRSKSPLLACVEEYFDSSKDDDELEDGDLPSLSKSRGTSLLNGGTSRTKPLRPPSMLGLEVPSKAERRQNSERFSKRARGSSPSWEDESEAPDDEMASLEMRGMQRKKPEAPRRSDENYDYPNVAQTESDDQFCDVASMLSNICGENKTQSPVRKATPAKRTLRPINDIPMDEYQIEEQTAIEIEYVEPDPREKAALAASKKNSYLTAMARKAKAEFDKTVPEKQHAEEKKSEIVEDEENETDVYSSFSATEKRKFLKMVNAGMTPTQSAKKVMEERESAGTPASSRRGLAFWKKPKPERSLSPGASKDIAGAQVKVPNEDPTLGNLQEAEDKNMVVPQEDRYDQYEAAGFDSESEDEDMESSHAVGNGGVQDEGARSRDAFIAIGPAPVAPAAVAAVVSRKTTAPTVHDVLPKSGSNYYDAVRRDNDAEEHASRSALLAQKAAQVRASRTAAVRSPTGTRSPTGNQAGFTPLNESEEGEVPATVSSEEGEVSSRSTAKRTSRLASARRFKMRGIRIGGFASVAENYSPERNQLQSSSAIGTSTGGDPILPAVDGAKSALIHEDAAMRDLLNNSGIDSWDDSQDDNHHLPSPVRVGGLAVNAVIPEDEEATSFDIVTPLSMVGSHRGRTVEVDGDRSLELDSYIDSPSAYSNNQDQMSIVSGKSHWTAATGATNYTTSSRVRRPGAAKVRLENAKKAEEAAITRKGWHESIKSAAAKSNQKWDPKEGFLDYEDSDVDPRGEKSEGPIHIQLKGLNKKPAGQQVVPADDFIEGESDGDIVWEEGEDDDDDDDDVEDEEDPHELRSDAEEDDSLLNDSEDGHDLQPGIQSDVQLLSPSESDDEDDSQLYAHDAPTQSHDVEARVISSEAKALPEAMATAKQEISEQRNMPTSPNVKRAGVDPPVSPSAYNRSQAPDPDGVRHSAIVRGVVTPTGGTAAMVAGQRNASTSVVENAGGMNAEASPQRNGDDYGVLETRSGGILFSMDAAEADSGDRLRPPSQASRSIGDADTITTAQDERYVQIGDTGSVRSFTYNQSPADPSGKKKQGTKDKLESSVGIMTTRDLFDPLLEQENTVDDDTAPLLVGDDFVRTADRTEVVKLKNTEDDISLFAHDSRNSFPKVDVPGQSSKRRGQGPVDLDEIDDFKRRGQGPVDIDEIDDMVFDDEADDETWPSAQIGSSPAAPSTVRAATAKKYSQNSPPKIKAPPKDTSPLRDRRRGSRTPRGDPHRNESVQGGSPQAAESLPESELRDPNEVWNSAYGHADKVESVPGAPREDPRGITNSRTASVRASEVLGNTSPDVERTSVVKNLARQWESRAAATSPKIDQESPKSPRLEGSRYERDSPDEKSPAGTAEWKSFLQKKVSAESAAAAKLGLVEAARPDPSEMRKKPDPSESRRGKDPDGALEDDPDDDSLFEFKPSMRDETGAFPTAAHSTIDEVDDSFSDISPIQAREDGYDDDEDEGSRGMEAVSDTGTNIEQGSFFKRLQACAAPMMPRSYSQSQPVDGNTVPSSHLAFLRSPPQSGGASSSAHFIPPNLCARPDTISEEVEELPSPIETARSSSSKRSKQRLSPRYGGSEVRSITSDDGFGSKTSYLESLAMEAAVSKPKRHGSRGRGSDEKSRSSNMSDVSASSRRSEKWQEFVDRKSIGISPEKRRAESAVSGSDHSSEVSKAAERYAARQVEEMMEAMARRRQGDKYSQADDMVSQSTGGVSPNAGAMSPYDIKGVRSDGSRTVRSVQTKNESVRAAEELAAARVEAMMAAMTSQSLDEGEI
ncbi:hypothetical protein MHU86_16785 [Fragilaria crotonensis]|nr:hypothetical protein MHU86_16785 [Fragilaria crotonensis]